MTARNGNGTFKAGVSGNPGGRSGQTQAIRAKLANGADAIAKKVIDAAKAGDMQACRLVLERLVPALKPTSSPVQFELDDSDLPSTARSIMRAIASGSLPGDQGKALLDAVLGMSRIIEISDLEQRLKAIEASMEGDE
jgi:hypothetical protein